MPACDDLGCQSPARYAGAYEWLGTSSGVSHQGHVWTSTPGGCTWTNGTWIAGDFNGDGKAAGSRAGGVGEGERGSARQRHWGLPAGPERRASDDEVVPTRERHPQARAHQQQEGQLAARGSGGAQALGLLRR